MSTRRGAPAPAVVGSHFVKQYYGEVLSKKPVELHRFYTDESTFCHASGTREEEPVSGLADIKAKIEHLGLGGATVDLGCGSVDAQPSEAGGVLLMVTGSITIADLDPRQFCQTFFLSRQHQDNDRHNYFVRNAIFRFLDVLPEVVQAALKAREAEEGDASRSMPAIVPVGGNDVTPGEGVAEIQNASPLSGPAAAVSSAPQTTPVPNSVVETAGVPADAIPPSSMAVGAAPPSESQVAASAGGGGGGGVDALPAAPPPAAAAAAAAVQLGNGSGGKGSVAKVVSPTVVVASPSPAPVAAAASVSPEAATAPAAAPAAAAPAAAVPAPAPAPPASPLPVTATAPPAPAVPTTYASMAKSWATVAAVGGDVAAPGLSAAGVGIPAASSMVAGAGTVSGNNGSAAVAAPVSNGGWGTPDVAVVAAAGGGGGGGGGGGVGGGVGGGGGGGVGAAAAVPAVAAVPGAGMVVEQPLPQTGSGGGQGSSRSSASGKGQKAPSMHIPHHASPAVAASAAAAREAAAAGNGEIMPATSLFVRKVDMTIDREEMVAHFSAYGEVTGISMNPTRGYAFIDYRSNDCVQSALSTKEHYVNRKLLVVEERHSPTLRPPREHGVGGRGGRNGGRGRASGGRDGRDGERGDRRSTGGRTGRGGGGVGRGDRPDGPGPKEGGGGYKARGRAEPA